jgi:hypothetical protein
MVPLEFSTSTKMAGVGPENACACGIFPGGAGYEIWRLTVAKSTNSGSARRIRIKMPWQGDVALKQAACFRAIREK